MTFFCRNPLCFNAPSNFSNLETSAPTNRNLLDTFFLDTPLPDLFLLDVPMPKAPAKAKYIKKDLQKIIKLYMDLFFQAQTNFSKLKNHQKDL